MLALMLALAASPPPDLVAVAQEVHALAPGPGGYGHDCVWRTEQVIKRLSPRRRAIRETVSAGDLCHAVAGVLTDGGEWLVDGQTGRVYEVRGRWAGPLYMEGCEGLQPRL